LANYASNTNDKDVIAMEKYGKKYYALCDRRKRVVDELLEGKK
jgi:hypothetical protein